MYCENCGKNIATTFIKKVVNGISTQKNLCSECAAQNGYGAFKNNSLSGFLASMIDGGLYDEYARESVKKCENCGVSFADISKTGKVGCHKCYDAFSNELMPFLKRLHGNVKHIGKVPNLSPLAIPNENDKINALRQELNTLIKNEEFEKAAQVRDKIRELEGEKKENE